MTRPLGGAAECELDHTSEARAKPDLRTQSSRGEPCKHKQVVGTRARPVQWASDLVFFPVNYSIDVFKNASFSVL